MLTPQQIKIWRELMTLQGMWSIAELLSDDAVEQYANKVNERIEQGYKQQAIKTKEPTIKDTVYKEAPKKKPKTLGSIGDLVEYKRGAE